MAVADWARIQATAHQITTEAVVLDVNGATIATPRLPVSSLRWGQNATTQPTLTATLTIPTHDTLTNVSWAPRNSDSALTPFGHQIKVDLKKLQRMVSYFNFIINT